MIKGENLTRETVVRRGETMNKKKTCLYESNALLNGGSQELEASDKGTLSADLP